MKRIARITLIFATLAPAEAPATARLILDYRDRAVRDGSVSYGPTERARLARITAEEAPVTLRQEIGKNFAVMGDASDAFTRPGARERISIIQEKAPVAIEPFPDAAAPDLLVITPDEPTRFFHLPKAEQYQRLVAATDMDDDGRSEILLEATFANMGERVTALTAARLDHETATGVPGQVIRDVFTDRCDAEMGRKARIAATVSADGSRRLTARRHALTCRLGRASAKAGMQNRAHAGTRSDRGPEPRQHSAGRGGAISLDRSSLPQEL